MGAGRFEVLIVDDERTNLMLMDRLIRQLPDWAPLPLASANEAVAALNEHRFALIIVDYQMPGLNGVQLIEAIRAHPDHHDCPIVMVTADKERSVRLAAISAGATEFLHKPIDPLEFRARIGNLAKLCRLQVELADRAVWLKTEVDRATEELRRREEEIIHRLALAADFKDKETALHTMRMARYCGIIARELGFSDDDVRDLELAAPMHDIGKVGIPDAILLKEGPLGPEERLAINEHTLIGAHILSGSSSALLELAVDIAASHHERWDGSGYPLGLGGNDIPLVGRIAAVADVFDALTSERPYKQAWDCERAFAFLRERAGSDFDPACVDAFLARVDEVMAVRRKFAEAPAVSAEPVKRPALAVVS